MCGAQGEYVARTLAPALLVSGRPSWRKGDDGDGAYPPTPSIMLGAPSQPPQVKMAEDIDFKYPMKKACAWEISSFCPNVPHGHARVVRCLQDKMDHEDMSK